MALSTRFMNLVEDAARTALDGSDTKKEGVTNVLRSVVQGGSLPPEELIFKRLTGEAMNFVGAGTETTGRTLAVTLYHLLANPTIYDRLFKEIRTVMPDSDAPLPTTTALEKLPYLTAVLQEGMRCAHGTAGRLVRIAPDEDLRYGDYVIPRGATFSQSQYLVHTHEKYFPDPLKFDPERFLGPLSEAVRKHFWPFGRGNRSCLVCVYKSLRKGHPVTLT
jgi:cytochrome P450